MSDRRLRVLIVDDEAAARRGVRHILATDDGVEVVGECGDGASAVTAIAELAPDVVFLDIQMPELDGFEVIERVGAENLPVVVFVTAYDEHALRAFEVHAIDYVLKPMAPARLLEALDRAREIIGGSEARDFQSRVADLLAAEAAGDPAEGRFLVRGRGRMVLVGADQITWVEAVGDYVRLHTERGVHLTRLTMAEADERLAPFGFLRIHRSTIARLDSVLELRCDDAGRYHARLADGAERPVSRSGRERLEERLGEL